MTPKDRYVLTRQMISVGLLAILLLGLAEFFARQAAPDAQPTAGLSSLRYIEAHEPPLDRGRHYKQVVLTIAVTYVLLIPALCFFAYRRVGEPMGAWLAFWTWSFVAYLVHLYWAIFGMMGGNLWFVTHVPRLVNHPYNDIPMSLAWGLDVVGAWLVVVTTGDLWKSPRWMRAFRGFVLAWLFAAFTGVWLTKAENWYVRGLGFFLTTSVLIFATLRVVIKPFDAGSLAGRAYVGIFRIINLFSPWHKLWTPMAIANLGAYRETLRAENLHDTKDIPVSNPAHLAGVPTYESSFLIKRHDDGYYNDLGIPSMGGASVNTDWVAPAGPEAQPTHDSMYFNQTQPGARFGRNVPLEYAHCDEANLLIPNPRVVSNELLARGKFQPATILNLLAAAWIQFETHDWFNHGEPLSEGERLHKEQHGIKDPYTSEQYRPHEVPISAADEAWGKCPMRVRPTRPDPTRDYAKEPRDASGRLKFPRTYANAESHWWDGSQIYGSSPETVKRLRSDYETDADGKLRVDEKGQLIPTGELLADGKLFIGKDGLSLDPSTGTVLSGFTGNWWLGMSLLHTLFTREHNAICDAIRREYPYWPGDRVFEVARLVNAALIAKIHTIEWTPAILQHPALQVGMAANWWGLLGEQVKKMFGRISQNEAFSGIPGSGVEHGAADYTLTEEFVSVYRLHPLMPDKLEVLAVDDGRKLGEYVLPNGVVGDQSRLEALNNGASMGDLFYSFGVTHPGAVELHNYPNFLRKLTRPLAYGTEEVVDLASIDILRDRERGVPRYNQFRRLLRCSPVATFEDFKNPKFPTLGADLRRVYGTKPNGGDNVELLDLMVGMFAEVPPDGFGFSDTAFRIFILMASRRLKSERFIAGEAFIPDVYTQVGLDWLENTTMCDILVRHYPELRTTLYGVENAFAPWKRVEVNPGA
jgi:hypothetical protein